MLPSHKTTPDFTDDTYHLRNTSTLACFPFLRCWHNYRPSASRRRQHNEQYDCCSQGFVFPRQKTQDLIAWYQKVHIGSIDMLTEQYAEERGELRLVLTPSIVQHKVGRVRRATSLARIRSATSLLRRSCGTSRRVASGAEDYSRKIMHCYSKRRRTVLN
jgi:hypothetical protein